jgi:hypothetical protein
VVSESVSKVLGTWRNRDVSNEIYWLNRRERMYCIIATVLFIMLISFVVYLNLRQIEQLRSYYSHVPPKTVLQANKLSANTTLAAWRKFLLKTANLKQGTTLSQWNAFVGHQIDANLYLFLPAGIVVVLLALSILYARRSIVIVPLLLAGLMLGIFPFGAPWIGLGIYLGYRVYKLRADSRIQSDNPTTDKAIDTKGSVSNGAAKPKRSSPLDEVRKRRQGQSQNGTRSQLPATKRYTPPKRNSK